MPEIEMPFPLKDIPVKPEMTGRVKLDETMIQTLAALTGWNGEARRLLTCALRGSLHVTTPPVCCITNKVTTGPNESITFGNIPTTEVLIMANPNNGHNVWVNVGAAAGDDTGWVLQAGDILNISINNMRELKLFVVTSGDKVIIIRTV